MKFGKKKYHNDIYTFYVYVYVYIYRLYRVGGAYVDTPTVLPLASSDCRSHPVYTAKLSLFTPSRRVGK